MKHALHLVGQTPTLAQQARKAASNRTEKRQLNWYDRFIVWLLTWWAVRRVRRTITEASEDGNDHLNLELFRSGCSSYRIVREVTNRLETFLTTEGFDIRRPNVVPHDRIVLGFFSIGGDRRSSITLRITWGGEAVREVVTRAS